MIAKTKMSWLVMMLVVAMASGLAGCYRHHLVIDESVGQIATKRNYDKSKWYHSFLGGLINGTGHINVSQYCPSGVGKVEDRHAFVTGLVTFLTLYIYSPTRVKVWCKKS